MLPFKVEPNKSNQISDLLKFSSQAPFLKLFKDIDRMPWRLAIILKSSKKCCPVANLNKKRFECTSHYHEEDFLKLGKKYVYPITNLNSRSNWRLFDLDSSLLHQMKYNLLWSPLQINLLKWTTNKNVWVEKEFEITVK